MNTKDIKYYETLFDFVRIDYMNRPDALTDFFKFCADYDLPTALRMWDLFFSINEKEISISRQISRLMSSDIFYILVGKNEQRTLKAVMENPTLLRALFMYNPDGLDEYLNKTLVDYILGNKIKYADEILKNLIKNTATDKTFGELMKIVMERLVIEFLKKSSGTRTAINKKQSKLLNDYIGKIKGSERSLLLQRVKEIS